MIGTVFNAYAIATDFKNYLKSMKKYGVSTINDYKKRVLNFFLENPEGLNLMTLKKFISGTNKYYLSRGLKAYIVYTKDQYEKKDYEEMLELLREARRKEREVSLEKELLEEGKEYVGYSLSIQDLLRIINNMTYQGHKIIALIQVMTGMRYFDVINIKRENVIPILIDNEYVLKLISVGKGNKRYVTYLYEPLIKELLIQYMIEHYEPTGYIFLLTEDYKGQILKQEDVIGRLRAYRQRLYLEDLGNAVEKAGFKRGTFTSHDFRRNFARRAYEKFKDLLLVKHLLNHARIETTEKYINRDKMFGMDKLKELQKVY